MPSDPGVADRPLVLVGPPVVADACAGEVDGAVDAGRGRSRSTVPPVGVPGHLVRGAGGRVPDEPDDVVARRAQPGDERGADEPGRAGDDDLHGSILPAPAPPAKRRPGSPVARSCPAAAQRTSVDPRAMSAERRSEAEVGLEGAFLEALLDGDEERARRRRRRRSGGRSVIAR